MEEAQVGEGHRHAVLLAGRDHLLVRHTAAGLRDEAHAHPARVVDGVAEGEEGIAGHGHAR